MIMKLAVGGIFQKRALCWYPQKCLLAAMMVEKDIHRIYKKKRVLIRSAGRSEKDQKRKTFEKHKNIR